MRQAMIFAAGLGTRLKPLTDQTPKALINVGGKPLLEHVITLMKDAGIERVVINVHHLAEQITSYVEHNDFGLNVVISDESETLLDTGGGLKHAENLFAEDSPILIHNVDILSNVNLKNFYSLINDEDDALLLVSNRQTSRYLLFDNDMRLVGWTNVDTGEVRSPYNNIDPAKFHKYAFSGIHTLSPKLFEAMRNMPDKFGIIDFYLNVCAQKMIRGYAKSDLKLLDVGKLNTLADAEKFVKHNCFAANKLP